MSNTQVFDIDMEGNAYGRPAGKSDDELTRVGPGSPCGEYLRRFWHPIALASAVTTTPQRVRILGENLYPVSGRKGPAGSPDGALRPIAGLLCTMAASTTQASPAVITGGSSMYGVVASISRASPTAAPKQNRGSSSPGIRRKSAMDWCLPTWGPRARSRSCRASISSKISTRTKKSIRLGRRDLDSARMTQSGQCPATGFNSMRTRWIHSI